MAKEAKIEEIEAKIAEMKTLMRNLINAVETGDSTAVEQTAAAGRTWLDQNPVQ